MVSYKTTPQFQVTTTYGGSSYIFTQDQVPQGRIMRVENGFDTATLYINDRKSQNWLNTLDANTLINIGMKGAGDSAYTTIFDGIIRFISTILGENEITELKCDGAGFGFADTIISHEYGMQSANPTLDTMREIITTATSGIVDGHVNNMFTDHVTDTGHSYTADNTTVENIVGTIRYLYYPFKPCSKALNDLMEVMQGLKGSSAGPHWIVTTDDKLLVCTLGASHPDAANNGWYRWYGNSQANATLTQGVDFKESQFDKLSKEANYVLYHGAFQYPSGTDLWTEGATCDDNWSVTGGVGVDYDVTDDNATYRVGLYSLRVRTGSGAGANWAEVRCPNPGGANWTMDDWGGQFNIPTFNFYIRAGSANLTLTQVDIFFYHGIVADGNYYYYRYNNPMRTANEWYRVTVPVGPYAKTKVTDELTISTIGAPDWGDIDQFGIKVFSTDNNQATAYIDQVHFAGYLLRGARDTSAAISATNPFKVKVITDDIAKDDTMYVALDNGTMACLAHAELLRCRSQPIVGWVKTPIIIDALPGMSWYIQAKPTQTGTYRIQKEMRCPELMLDFGMLGYSTTLKLTDDLTNSNTRLSWMDMNKAKAAIRPEFQDRQASSIKAREIDITQTILENSYA